MFYIGMVLTTGGGCSDPELPVMGPEGHRVADFRFQDQDSIWIDNETFDGKIYVADFFFTSCPTICPIMSRNMLMVSEHFQNNPSVGFLSHSIDYRHDSIPELKRYATKLGANTRAWHFVTGKPEIVYALAENSYFSAAAEEADAPGGYIHSGGFALIDRQRRLRGIYDGTVDEDVSQMIKDMERLLKEK